MLRVHTESVHSFWLCTDAASLLFDHAKRRVYAVRRSELLDPPTTPAPALRNQRKDPEHEDSTGACAPPAVQRCDSCESQR